MMFFNILSYLFQFTLALFFAYMGYQAIKDWLEDNKFGYLFCALFFFGTALLVLIG